MVVGGGRNRAKRPKAWSYSTGGNKAKSHQGHHLPPLVAEKDGQKKRLFEY